MSKRESIRKPLEELRVARKKSVDTARETRPWGRRVEIVRWQAMVKEQEDR